MCCLRPALRGHFRCLDCGDAATCPSRAVQSSNRGPRGVIFGGRRLSWHGTSKTALSAPVADFAGARQISTTFAVWTMEMLRCVSHRVQAVQISGFRSRGKQIVSARILENRSPSSSHRFCRLSADLNYFRCLSVGDAAKCQLSKVGCARLEVQLATSWEEGKLSWHGTSKTALRRPLSIVASKVIDPNHFRRLDLRDRAKRPTMKVGCAELEIRIARSHLCEEGKLFGRSKQK